VTYKHLYTLLYQNLIKINIVATVAPILLALPNPQFLSFFTILIQGYLLDKTIKLSSVDALSTTIISYEYESFKFNIDSMQLDVNKQVL